MKLRTETALRPVILATFLLALAAVLLVSAPGPAYGAGEPGKPTISNWDRLHQGLRVHWYAPGGDGGSPITRYEVQYKATDADNWTNVRGVGTTRKATITGLRHTNEYQVRVRAVNANGAGPWTDDPADKGFPRGVTQYADPPDVTVLARNGSLVVSWDPPAYFGTAPASHYNVQYAPFDSPPYTYKDWTVDGSAEIIDGFVTITGLENGQDHLVRVRAHNGYDGGGGYWSVDYHGIPGPYTPKLKIEELVTGLKIPWDVAFTPDGTMLFTQRSGALGVRRTDGRVVKSISADLADVKARGEGGLMAILVDPDFSSNRRFYTCQRRSDPSEVQVIAWTMNNDYNGATRVADPLIGGIPAGNGYHNGCRLRFGPDGHLWVATGDASQGANPQDLSSLGGKVLRVDASTGGGATGNPFSDAPLVYTYGHRNIQGLALRAGTRQMWSVEHGPTVDDEINLLSAGGNYGWDPVPGYNQRVPMTDLKKYPGAIPAKYSSGSSTLATSGGIFLGGSNWRNWEGRLAVAALKNRQLYLFAFDENGEFQSRLSVPELKETYGRLRTPMMGPDGALYLTTSIGEDDMILKVTAASQPGRPAAPTVVRRDGSPGELDVSWTAPTDDGGDQVAGYQLRYSRDGVTWNTETSTLTGLTKTISGLDDGAEYQVQVRAMNQAGDSTWSQSGTGTTNRAPTVVSGIGDATIVNESGRQEVSLSGVFDDADSDDLTVSAASSADATATVSVAADQSKLTVTARARGTATITVTASDGHGGTVSDAFTVKVKAAPAVASAIADLSSLVTEATRDVSLSGTFSDADNDPLTITAASSDDNKATVSVAGDYSKLTVTGVAEGTAIITVTAQDADGNRVSDAFDAAVVKSADASLSALALSAGSIAPAFSSTTYAYTLAVGNGVSSTTVTASSGHGGATLKAGLSGSLSSVGSGTASGAISLAEGANALQVEVTAEDGTTKRTYAVTVSRNRMPTVSSGISDLTIVNEGGTHEVSLSGVFSDADGDSLTITAGSSDANRATVSVAGDHSSLTVKARARGMATITVTAADGRGSTVADTFTVTVKAAPVAASALADISDLEASATLDVLLDGVFSDADNDALIITATSSDDAKATASVSPDYSKLTLTGVAEGAATITVTAEDADGNRVNDAFDVSVVELPGPVANLAVSATDTGDGIIVSWQAPESGGTVKGYIAHARPVKGGAGSGKTRHPKADELSVTFPNLETGLEYRIWVRAENAAGKGERVHATIELSPAPTEAPGPVLNLRVTAAADSVSATWEAPATGGAPTRYIAHIRPEGGPAGSGETKYPKTKKPATTFRDLEAGRTYKVWVRAENAVGKGERVHATITLPEPE